MCLLGTERPLPATRYLYSNMGRPGLRDQFLQTLDFDRFSNKRQKTHHDNSPRIEDLVSQYDVLHSLATSLCAGDLLNLGLVSRTIWTMLSSDAKPLRIRSGLVKHTLRCEGLQIQTRPQSPHQGTPYVLPCTSDQLARVKQCEGCGIGLCEVRQT
jgi:hypothetical protein